MATKKPIPSLPEPVLRDSKPYVIDDLGQWLILSDVHIPYHDVTTVELAIEEARRRKVKGVLLNGDITDHHELSRFDKSPDDPRYPEEIKKTKQFFDYLRDRLPKVKTIWKGGNHEARLLTYLMQRAPALWGLDVLSIPHLMDLKSFGIEYIEDLIVVQMGKLFVLHGHEYRPTIQAPVNPARGLFLRAKGNSICGHFHQTSEHHEPTISGKPQGCWSTGAACALNPRYFPYNKWNHGCAFVDLGKGGAFGVDNLRVIDKKLV